MEKIFTCDCGWKMIYKEENMPKTKEYKFENESNSNIVITIKAQDSVEAVTVLNTEVKHPQDYVRI